MKKLTLTVVALVSSVGLLQAQQFSSGKLSDAEKQQIRMERAEQSKAESQPEVKTRPERSGNQASGVHSTSNKDPETIGVKAKSDGASARSTAAPSAQADEYRSMSPERITYLILKLEQQLAAEEDSSTLNREKIQARLDALRALASENNQPASTR